MLNKLIGRILYRLVNPSQFVSSLLKAVPFVKFSDRLKYDAVARPHLAYGMFQAAMTARQLEIPRISAIEFGVAGGEGLLTMEKLALEIERETGVQFDVIGFDTGEGLPTPDDYRDLPYIWKKGFYKMDVERLRQRLNRARLILGDVRETVVEFVKQGTPAPLGFVSFDLDYYTSTRDALTLFRQPDHERFLPRVFCYFDDVMGDDWELHCEDAGELLAIREFNEESDSKIRPIHGLAEKRALRSRWAVKFFVLHRFHHPRYCDYIFPAGSRQLEAKP